MPGGELRLLPSLALKSHSSPLLLGWYQRRLSREQQLPSPHRRIMRKPSFWIVDRDWVGNPRLPCLPGSNEAVSPLSLLEQCLRKQAEQNAQVSTENYSSYQEHLNVKWEKTLIRLQHWYVKNYLTKVFKEPSQKCLNVQLTTCLKQIKK